MPSFSVDCGLTFEAAFLTRHEQEQMTRHRLETYWNKYFPTIMPKEVILNQQEPSFEWVNDNDLGEILEEVFEIGYIVPFIESLKQFLSIKEVYEAVLLNFQSNNVTSPSNNNYCDVWDGHYIKEHSYYIEHCGRILCFQVYMDEFEPANPLGSKKSKHKVSVFYWQLMNLPPMLRSSLRSIQLLGIVSSDLLKSRGVDVFLKPFIDDLLILRDGHTFTIRNEESKWFGILLHFVGDMPASNFVGGFKEGVGFAKLPCRSCMIVRTDLETIHHESDCILRNQIMHEQQVLQIENAAEISQAAKDTMSSNYGINRRSPFDRLGYFDSTRCFMHDLMHVVPEGVLNDCSGLLLQNLILDPAIKLNLVEVNRKISTLKSGREFTVPPQIRLNEVLELKKLSFSSSEMMSLSMCLPIVLADYVSIDNPHFANYLLLLEIISSLQCYSFQDKDLVLLATNIEMHNRNHVLLYPKNVDSAGKAITPKFHTLLHFASQIRLFGPPRCWWCFRYESKNARFKKVMRRNCNFRNVPYTFATNHQKLMSLDIKQDGQGAFLSSNLENFKVHVKHSPIELQYASWWHKCSNKDEFPHDLKFQTLQTLRITGRICKAGTVFLRHLQSCESQPVFFRISEAILLTGKTFLVMEEMETMYFDQERFCFIAIPLQIHVVISRDNLEFAAPLHSFFYNNQLLVRPNYYHMLC